jgi:endonuclease/exonuclease/phosphatase family metal-dependent hydrolase
MGALRRWLGKQVLILAAVVSLGSMAPRALHADEPAIELRVMTFNMWYGGAQVNAGQVVEAIRAARADIVGLQEPDGTARAIATALGWPYVDERRHILSRYPLFDPPGDPLYVWVEPLPGRIVAVANVHMPATPYGPEAVRDGQELAAVMKMETDTRMPAIQPYLEALPKAAADGTPVFLTGDFNSPSHLDWTAAVAKVRPQEKYAVEWPVSKALADAGLRDSYREAHPDPVARAGLTWTAGYPYPRIKPGETFDRIDLVWSAGNTQVIASEVVGEAGGPDVDIPVTPWPSDHRAVVSTFRVRPGIAPAMVGVDRRVITQGDDFILRFGIVSREDARISVVPKGGDPAKDAVATMATGDASDRPSIKLGSTFMKAGAYDAVLSDADGKELARTPFWVLGRDAMPAVAAKKASYKPGQTINVSWHNAPSMRFDWVAVYRAGDPDIYNYIAYIYTGATVEGSGTFDSDALGGPLEPGNYELRLLRDDSYVLLARAPFTIK